MRPYFSTLLILWFLLGSCQKEDRPQLDLVAPAIDISSPVIDGKYQAGSRINLYVEFSDNQSLHDYSVVLRNEDRSVAETIALGHSHENYLILETEFELPNLQNQFYTLTVKASDHNDNLSSKRIEFTTE